METICHTRGALPLTITGQVQQGKKIGRRLGFPTANIAYPEGGCDMPCGVYLAVLTLPDGTALHGVLNHGHHPTLPEGPPAVEVHLLDFDGDLYGRKVQVEYLRFVRPEIKFPSVEDMRAQVMRDIEEAKRFFAAGEAEKETGE